MQPGIHSLSQHLLKKLKSKRLGLLCHAASVDEKIRHLLQIFTSSRSIQKSLVRLFAPEHGLWAIAQDMESVDSMREASTQLPVQSLYGSSQESLKPNKEMLEGLDLVICDLQDVGSRYYTFVYSIALMMQACKEAGIPVWILDRPNPINGISVEGNIVEKGFESFVGMYPIANRHGMTVGELVEYFNEEFKIHADLTVISLKGWNRKSYFDETGLPWVLPSPNMPTLDTALVYPGMCLVEATEISEGRGTTRPFEIIGAPYIDPEKLGRHLKSFDLSGVRFRPLFFKPTFQKCAGQTCGGVQLYVTHRNRFKPYLTGLAVLKAIYDLYPDEFRWREKPYEFVDKIPAIDLLSGSATFRTQLESGASWKKINENYEEGKEGFLKRRKKYLRY